MRLASQRVEEIREEESVEIPLAKARDSTNERRLGREVVDQDGELPDGELASPQIREVDAVEAEEVSFYGVAVIAECAGELLQFPEIPRAL